MESQVGESQIDSDYQDGVEKRMRQARSISWKIDVCNYLFTHNGNITATAKYFGILRKQVRYYRSRHEIYIAFSNKAVKKNLVQVSASKARAKYFMQELELYKWVMGCREEGLYLPI